MILRIIIALLLTFDIAHAQAPGGNISPPPGVPASGGTLPGPFALGDTNGNFNAAAPQYNHWRKVLANVRAGTGRGKIAFVGDSTNIGTGAGTGGTNNLNSAYPNAWPQQLAGLMNGSVPTSANSFFNSQGSTIAYGTYDPRVVLGTGWTNAAVASLGGAPFYFTSGSAGTLSFTPTSQFDTIIVWYLQLSGAPNGGTATVNVDGGSSLGTISTSGSPTEALSATYTVTRGNHTVNIVANNDANFYILGVETYDSAVPAVDFLQVSQYGSTAAANAAAGSGYSPIPVLEQLAPDLTIVNLTINDSNAQTSLSSYTTNIQAIITAAKLSGDVLLMAGPPSNTSQATNGTLQQYIGVLQQLAISNNVGFLSIPQRWTSYAVTNPLMPYFDTLHPEAQGYQDIALAVEQNLLGTNGITPSALKTTTYTASTTGTIPGAAKLVRVLVRGQGGCGGGGVGIAAAGSGSGGGGGGGGSVKDSGWFPATQVSGTYTVTVATQCAAAAAGTSGSAGGNVSFAMTGIDTLVGWGGGGGAVGASGAASGGGGGAGTGAAGSSTTNGTGGSAGNFGGAAGGSGASGANMTVQWAGSGGGGSTATGGAAGVSQAGYAEYGGTTGGAPGGGCNAGTAAVGGTSVTPVQAATHAGGAATGGAGTTGQMAYASDWGGGGGSGGGGNSGTSTVGGAGGAGGAGGGGGGGGGTACGTSSAGGSGGVGGAGQVVMMWQ